MAHFDDPEWPTCDGQTGYPLCARSTRGRPMRRRRASVELFEEIRREYEFGVGTVQGVARKFGVHRRMVREALASARPMGKPPAHRPRPRLDPVTDFIEAVLVSD